MKSQVNKQAKDIRRHLVYIMNNIISSFNPLPVHRLRRIGFNKYSMCIWCTLQCPCEQPLIESLSATKNASTLNPDSNRFSNRIAQCEFNANPMCIDCVHIALCRTEFTHAFWLQVATPPHSYYGALIRSLRPFHTRHENRIECALNSVCRVHTDCCEFGFEAMRIECASIQSTSGGGLEPNRNRINCLFIE